MPSSGVAAVINSLASTPEDEVNGKNIEAFWWGQDFIGAEEVGIWSHDPTENLDDALEYAPVSDTPEGRYIFSIQFNDSVIPKYLNFDRIDSGACLPYWVGILRDEELIDASCLKSEPYWMEDLQDILTGANLCDILIPGTHDAGAATSYENWGPDGPLEDEVARWTFTQDGTFWTQLVMGIRYLDMRLSYYPDSEFLYYVNHNFVRIAPLYLYLEDISRFLNQTNEILIFDTHSLENNFEDYPEAEKGLLNLIESYLLPWMVPNTYGPNPKLGDIWDISKNIIVTFPGNPSDLYWDQVLHVWGDVNNLDDLFNYFDEQIPYNAGRTSLWSAMTELTPSSVDVTVNRWGGLTGASNITNIPVSLKFRSEWWTQANIVSMDFFLGSDVVDIAIDGNAVRHGECQV